MQLLGGVSRFGSVRFELKLVVAICCWLGLAQLSYAIEEELLVVGSANGGRLVVPNHRATADNRIRLALNSDGLIQISEENRVFEAESALQLPSGPTTTLTKSSLKGPLRIDTGDGNDVLIVDLSNGNPIPEAGLIYDGGNQPAEGLGDSLEIIGGSADLVTHTFINPNDGSVAFTLDNTTSRIDYVALEPVTDNLNATDRIFTFTGGSETITLKDDATSGNDISFIDSTLGEQVTFLSPSNSLAIVFSGAGSDIFASSPVDSQFPSVATIRVIAESNDLLSHHAEGTLSIDSATGSSVDFSYVNSPDIMGSYGETNGVIQVTMQANMAVSSNLIELSPTSSFSVIANFTYEHRIGERFTLIDNVAPARAITGNFENLPEGSIVTLNEHRFSITYVGGTDNNDVVLTALASKDAGAGIEQYNTFFDNNTVCTTGSTDDYSVDHVFVDETMALGDDSGRFYTLPFEFPYFDQIISEISIGNNGGIVLHPQRTENPQGVSFSNAPLPSTIYDYAIFPFWDDIDSESGAVYVSKLLFNGGPGFIEIQWNQRPHFDNVGAATFTLSLFADGKIRFTYQDIVFDNAAFDNGASATTGIQGLRKGVKEVIQTSFNSVIGFSSVCFVPDDDFLLDVIPAIISGALKNKK